MSNVLCESSICARQVALRVSFARVRELTIAMTEGLSAEDCQLQSMPDASPVKWHLGHVTWFFETFVLEPNEPGHAPVEPAYRVLFNSYYVGIGTRHPRSERGLLSRPSLVDVLDYRRAIDARVDTLLAMRSLPRATLDLVELGLNHSPVVEHIDERRSRQEAPLGTWMPRADTHVVRVEQHAIRWLDRCMARLVRLEHERLEEPGHVSEMPLDRRCVGHRLQLAVLRRQALGHRNRKFAHARERDPQRDLPGANR